MSSVPAPGPPAPSPEPIFRLSVDQYHAMIDAGVLTEDDPVELIEGILLFKTPKKPRHRLVIRSLTTLLDTRLPTGWHFQAQEPITLDDSEPEPDGAIVRGQPRDYTERHPGSRDVAVIIEVADTTLERDRGIKLRGYARGGIPIYWIIDLASGTVERYSHPDPTAPNPTYRQRQISSRTDVLEVELDGAVAASVAVNDVLG